MDTRTITMLLLGGVSLAVLVWVLHKIGKALIALFRGAGHDCCGVCGAVGTG